MQRALWVCAVLFALSAAPATADTQLYFGFKIEIGDAPSLPTVTHDSEPKLVMVPDLEVYVVAGDDQDNDVFRFGAEWYTCNGGFWYRAKKYGGPYVVISARSVPSAIFYVPRKHWRHHDHGPKWIREKGHDAARRDAWAHERRSKKAEHDAARAKAGKSSKSKGKDKRKGKNSSGKKKHGADAD